MNTRPIPLLPLSVLTLLVALTFWLSQVVQLGISRPEEEKRHDPDLIIENFSAQKLNVAGDAEYSLNARKMLHFQDDDSSLLESVVFVVTQPGQPRLTAKAPRGQLLKRLDSADEVIMDGGVRVESEPNDRYPLLKLATPKLTVIPDQNLARSTDGVLVESPTGDLRARSFLLNTVTRRIEFETVEMNYAPRRQP